MIQSALELCTASNVAMSIRTNCRFKIGGNNLTLKKRAFSWAVWPESVFVVSC